MRHPAFRRPGLFVEVIVNQFVFLKTTTGANTDGTDLQQMRG
jgi:hypothetical protein